MLLKKKEYTKIKITDIAAKSGYSRQAIYFYYETKDCILKEIMNDLADGLIDLRVKANAKGFQQALEWLTEPCHPLFLQYFAFMRHNSEIFLILLNQNAQINFISYFRNRLEDYEKISMAEIKKVNGAGNHGDILQLYAVVIKDLTNSLLQWVQNGMEPDEVVMATYHTRIWIGTLLLLKDTAQDSIYTRLVEKMKEKGVSFLEQD